MKTRTKTQLLLASLLAFLLTLPGCASAISLAAGKGPYGGVQLDGITVSGASQDAQGFPLAVMALFDLPFSFAMDTLLLPVTMVAS